MRVVPAFLPALVATLALAAGGCGSGGEVVPAPAAAPVTVAPATTVVRTTTSTVPTTTAAPATTTTTAAPATTTTTTTLPMGPTALECVADLPIGLRVGQVLLPVVVQSELPVVADLASRGLVAGAVMVGPAGDGFAPAVAAVQEASATGPVVIAVDEEGGNVQRFASLLGDLPSAVEMAAWPADEVRRVATERAVALAGHGVTVNLAPVLDVGPAPGIGSRSFSDDPVLVAGHGAAFAEGVLAAGLVPVAKHFPGHGRANADSHEELATTPPVDDLREVDLLPFALVPEGTAVMVGHLAVPGLTDGVPASLSAAAVTGLLRDELGFDGVVVTDDLSMGAVAQLVDVPTAARLALIAGADLLMVGGLANVVPAAWGLVAALDERTLDAAWLDEAVERVLALRDVDPCALVVGGLGRSVED
ncbi:MAG: beta-glucosidase [Acidimicrobiaceae bacterium]|nr:beta-glucosidase [Acidimicrobiaceae bacterium]